MRELETSAIHRRTSEDYIILVDLIRLVDILRSGEPHKVYHTTTICKMGNNTLLACRHLKLLKRQYLATYLYKRHIACQFVYGINATSIHIFIWIVLEQIGPCAHVELAVEYLLTLRSDARQKHYVLRENVQVWEF